MTPAAERLMYQTTHDDRLWCFSQDGGSPLREPALRYNDLCAQLEEAEQDGEVRSDLREQLAQALADCVAMAARYR